MSNNSFSTELLTLVQKSISERGLENSLIDTVANQFVIEQVQTEFHCILNALISILIENNLIDEAKLRDRISEKVKEQEEFLQETLDKEKNSQEPKQETDNG